MICREDGGEWALGPLEEALVKSVLGAAAKMRRERSYQIHLHVKHGAVVVQVLQHVGDVIYPCD